MIRKRPWERWRQRNRSRRMFWRVYLHGLLLLFATGLTVMLMSVALSDRSYWHDAPERLAERLARTYTDSGGDPGILKKEVVSLGRLVAMNLSVYDMNNNLLATTVEPPIAPLADRTRSRLDDGSVRAGRACRAFEMQDGGVALGYVMVDFRAPADGQHQERIFKGALGFFAVLLTLAIASFPLVRTIVSPLERLTKATRAFGSGDLSVRTGLRCHGEAGELARAFDDMAERIERLVLGEKELLANVSHELRTPMARIRVALELAAEGDTVEAQRYLREIGTDLSELERLVEDVLTSARLDLARSRAGNGTHPLRRAPFNSLDLMLEVAARFERNHPDRTLVLEVPEVLPRIEADLTLLRRVIDNLLENAVKYADSAPIVLKARHVETSLVIEVRDRGPGISPEDLPHLFEPFFRTDRSRTRSSGGVGLGLTLARRIVEAHGGRIDAESEPGNGTTIRFVLPVPQEDSSYSKG